MDEIEINAFLKENKKTKNHFLGVLAYDELPHTQPDGFYIVNTGHSETVGIHWVVILKEGNIMEFFDSLGKTPDYYTSRIEQYLLRNGKYYKMNIKRLQGQSDVCANYCILYGYFRCINYSMEDILNIFSSNLEKNDILVNLD